MGTTPVSAVVTTFNSARTLAACLESVAFCDECVVLDSGSTDATRAIAESFGARVIVEAFKGYSAQKQAAIDHARHDWVLLLDSDEWLEPGAGEAIRRAAESSAAGAFRLRRREWMFWRWQHAGSRHNRYVRLFDRRRARMSGHAVHEGVVAGDARDLPCVLFHAGDLDIAAKLDKVNRYSSLQQADIQAERRRFPAVRMVFYPTLAFLRFFVLRGHWREGWAGFVSARLHAFHAFCKYAKAYERSVAPKRGPVAVPARPVDQATRVT